MTAPAQVHAPPIAGAVSARWLLDLVDRLHDTFAAPPVRMTSTGAGLPGAMRSSDTRAERSARPKPRPAAAQPAPAASRHPRPGPGEPDGDAEAGVEAGVEPAHAETWQLVRRAQAGDGDAFGQLYDRYFDVVFRFIYFRVNDRTLAEDFTSETFLRALRRITSISYQGRDIGAWFVTIARNIVFDHAKSARHRLETPTADAIEGPIVGADAAPSTEAAVLAALQSQKLMRAVAKLGDEQRECIVLRFVQGMSVSETAEIMGKKDGAIKALQHRAVRKLADLVGPDPG
jgi:RNA polymerase sigma-70 factor (ECF subfamily)